MRFALYSDLHLEIKAWEPPDLDVDLVILAGDIGSHTRGLTWAAGTFRQPVIYIAGNHEITTRALGCWPKCRSQNTPAPAYIFWKEARSN